MLSSSLDSQSQVQLNIPHMIDQPDVHICLFCFGTMSLTLKTETCLQRPDSKHHRSRFIGCDASFPKVHKKRIQLFHTVLHAV